MVSLNQLGIYNPQRLSDDVVEKIFIARQKLFDFVFKKIVSEKTNSIPQHYIIIGQRGMGKSTLLKRTEVELRKKEYNNLFVPVLYPEEQYNLKDLAEFWLNTIDALADTLELEKHTDIVKRIDEKVVELAKLKQREELCKNAYDFFKEVTQELHRRPVLLIDNMNLLFDRMEEADQFKLRAWLTQKGSPAVLGASAVSMEDTYQYGAPFYDAFQFHYLKRLEFDELMSVLKNLATITDSANVQTEIYKNQSRLRTIHQLTGGNPRTVVLLFKLIVKGFSKDINDDLEALLDEVTPLYKAKFEELSEQLQIIVDAIALHWDPINLEQLRNETSYENNQLSPQLKRLVDVGWIEKLDAYQAKGHAYQITERFFNIWFLMRRSSRRQKKEIYCLSKFLETYYGDDIHDVARRRLGKKSESIESVYRDLALADAVKENAVLKYQLRIQANENISRFSQIDEKIREQFIFLEKENSEIRKLKNEGELLYNQKRWNELVDKTLELISTLNVEKQDKVKSYWVLGALYQIFLKLYKESERYYLKSIELDENFIDSFYDLGNLYANQLNEYDKAEYIFLKGLQVGNENNEINNCLGNLYQDIMHKYEEAEKLYLKDIEINFHLDYAKYNLIFLYRDKLGEIAKAEELFESLEINQEIEDSHWLNAALFELYKKNEGLAKEFALKAIKSIDDYLPNHTEGDWWRFASVVHKLGFHRWWLNVMEEVDWNSKMAPFYIAFRALSDKNPEAYLLSKAVELRDSARMLMDKIIQFAPR